MFVVINLNPPVFISKNNVSGNSNCNSIFNVNSKFINPT